MKQIKQHFWAMKMIISTTEASSIAKQVKLFRVTYLIYRRTKCIILSMTRRPLSHSGFPTGTESKACRYLVSSQCYQKLSIRLSTALIATKTIEDLFLRFWLVHCQYVALPHWAKQSFLLSTQTPHWSNFQNTDVLCEIFELQSCKLSLLVNML